MHDGYSAETVPSNLDGTTRPGQIVHHDTAANANEPPRDTAELPVIEQATSEPQGRSAIWEIVETLLLAVFIFIAVRSVVLNFRVDGLSMEPSLDSGEMLLVNRQIYFHFDTHALVNWLPFVELEGENIVYPFHPPQRGDIVVLHPPVDNGKPYIKRVIGLPGERLGIHDGAVYINGERLHEPYLNGIATAWSGSLGQEEITIPDDEVFVMGDNRNNSTDSRIFGPIKIDEIIGKAWISYWPTDRLDILNSPDYSQ
ncbi:MAG TPA: signal peptidase I [Thermomicrobiales bacterium]|nr:signal peptidase I [Thermomicrobiales bacterium]